MSDIVTAQFQDPMASFKEGLNFGSGIRKMQLEAQAAEDARQAAAEKAALEAERQARLAEFNTKIRSGTATINDYMAISGDMSKDQNDAMQAGWKMLDSEKQKSALKDTSELFSAFYSGNTDLGLSMMDNHIKALENSGNAQEAEAMRSLRAAAEHDPLAVAAYFGTTLGRMGEDGKKVLDNALSLQRENGQNLTAADIALKQAQAREADARAKDLLDKMKDKGIKLSDQDKTLINKAVFAASEANLLQTEYAGLANDFEASIKKLPAGAQGKVSEYVKSVLGTENTPTKLRQDYLRLRNSAALKMLPPGAASDKDVEIALGAFPKETTNPELIASFLRGIAKLQGYEANYQRSISEWLANNGTMAPATSDFQVNDKDVKAGMRFDQFMRKYIPRLSAEVKEAPTEGKGAKGAVEVDY
jgi:hypothetical protein